MKLFFSKAALLSLAASALFTSCRQNDDDIVEPPLNTTPGTVKLEFVHRAGNSPLTLNGQTYTNAVGETFTVSRFQYYISNVQLHKTDGTTWSEPESYHLITQGGSMEFDIASVPAGDYNRITYTIGVDSTRNVSGAQTGALDPANGMFWSWNSGYIMMKFEGNSPASPAGSNKILLHAGGFKVANSVIRTATKSLPATITVNSDAVQHIHLAADVLKMLNTPNPVSFATTHTIHMPGAAAMQLADNYADMFTVTHAGP